MSSIMTNTTCLEHAEDMKTLCKAYRRYGDGSSFHVGDITRLFFPANFPFFLTKWRKN